MSRPDDTPPREGRLLAIDLGDVRVGVAVTDPGQLVATPAQTLQVADATDLDALVARLVSAVKEHDPVGIVVGLPRRLDAREGAPARRAREVAAALRTATGLPVALWDERFTTVEAERVMLAQDARRRERRASIDRVAATLILQGFLESRRSSR